MLDEDNDQIDYNIDYIIERNKIRIKGLNMPIIPDCLSKFDDEVLVDYAKRKESIAVIDGNLSALIYSEDGSKVTLTLSPEQRDEILQKLKKTKNPAGYA